MMIISWNYCQFTPICRFLLRLEKVHLFSCFVLFERERTLYLLCMPIPLSLLENQQLYGTPFLLIWLLLFPFFKCYVWQFSQTLFYEICFVACTKIQLVTLWEIESRRPNLSAWKFKWTWNLEFEKFFQKTVIFEAKVPKNVIWKQVCFDSCFAPLEIMAVLPLLISWDIVIIFLKRCN